MSKTKYKIPETAFDAEVCLESAMEHASHAWAAMRKAGLIPDRPEVANCWPPNIDWLLGDVGTSAYHVAALINRTFAVYQGLLRQSEADEFKTLDDGYSEVPEG